MTKTDPICIEEIVDPGKIINNFRQSIVVTVIGLVDLLQFMEKPWLSEHSKSIT